MQQEQPTKPTVSQEQLAQPATQKVVSTQPRKWATVVTSTVDPDDVTHKKDRDSFVESYQKAQQPLPLLQEGLRAR